MGVIEKGCVRTNQAGMEDNPTLDWGLDLIAQETTGNNRTVADGERIWGTENSNEPYKECWALSIN